jgi:diguanylate cyclase (GGDEF)-like protein/PAS domain S-box-containing protein
MLSQRDKTLLALLTVLVALIEVAAFGAIGGLGPWPWLHLIAVTLVLGVLAWRSRESHRESGDLKLKLMHQKRLEVKAWYFESIIGYSANIIFTIDSENRILKFNRGSEKAFGVSQTDVVGREVHEMFSEPTAVFALLAQVDKEGTAENPCIRIRHADESVEIWLQASVTRMLRGDQEAIGTVFNCVDITKRRQLELELQEKNQQLLRLSITDGLTGLYNVRHFHDELTRSLKTLRRYPDRYMSIALIDIDQFKRYNDTHGHQAGDRLLAGLGKILQIEIRQSLDQAFRYGGDEFVLLLPDTKAEGARIICDRVRAAYAKGGFEPTDLSIGIASAGGQGQDDETLSGPDFEKVKETLVKRADVAMYTAKSQGGGTCLAP